MDRPCSVALVRLTPHQIRLWTRPFRVHYGRKCLDERVAAALAGRLQPVPLSGACAEMGLRPYVERSAALQGPLAQLRRYKIYRRLRKQEKRQQQQRQESGDSRHLLRCCDGRWVRVDGADCQAARRAVLGAQCARVRLRRLTMRPLIRRLSENEVRRAITSYSWESLGAE